MMRNSVLPRPLASFGVIMACLFMQACSILPTTIRDSAASLKAQEFQLDNNYFPGLSFSVAYGITDELDIGIDLEEVSSVWSKYSFAPSANGGQWAVNAALFTTTVESYDDEPAFTYGDERFNGMYLGAIYSHQLQEKTSLNIAYRYNYLNYDAFSLSQSGGWWFASSEYSFVNQGAGTVLDVSSSDLAGIGTLSATLSIAWKSHANVHFGASCQIYHTSSNPGIETLECAPVLGMSFFRR